MGPMARVFALAAAALAAGALPAHALAQARQPAQPAAHPHAGVRVTAGGTGADAWYLFEPAHPTPGSAPLAVVMHGYYEFSGYSMNEAIARHTARMGNVVIYPRWQTGAYEPCPGPFNAEPCVRSAVKGIKGALAYLDANRDHVRPQLDRAAYFGFSFGGIVTANVANRWRAFGVPEPRAIWLDDPHDGGLLGPGEPALDDSLAGIPAAAKVVCHSGADAGNRAATFESSKCNSLFPRLAHIPASGKALVMTSDDAHGSPALSSAHGVCAGAADAVDAYDWGFCWRSWDALRSCALAGVDCGAALGDTPRNRYVGTWSDGVPMIGLKVQDAAPIRPEPVPAREPRPDAPPVVRRVQAVRRDGRIAALRGTATDDVGIARVAVAVVRVRDSRCRQLTRSGRLTPLRECSRPSSFLLARGTSSWRLSLRRPLARGRYRVIVRVTDSAGQTTQVTRSA